MADQSFQQAQGTIRIVLQVGQMITTNLTQILEKLLEQGNVVEEELRKAYKNGKALTVEVSPQDEEQLARIMAEHGFGRDKMHPMQKCLIEQPDGTQKAIFLIMKQDEELAKSCLEELGAEKRLGGMISHSDMVRHAGMATCSVEMPSDCAMAMVMRAEQYGLKVSGAGPYTKDGEEKFKIFFAEKDRMLFNRVQMETMCDLQGKAGSIYRTMLEKESTYRAQAISSMIENRTPDMQNLRNGSLLVSASGATLEAKGSNLILKLPDGRSDYFKRADMEKAHVRARMEQHFAFDKIALLSPEQAKKYIEAGSLEAKEKVMMQGRTHPTGGMEPITILSSKEMDLLRRHEAERALIEQKLLEENPAYNYMSAQLYDGSPITQFMDEQNKNADLTHDIGERGLPFDERQVLDDAHAENIGDLFTEPEQESIPDEDLERIFEPEKESRGFNGQTQGYDLGEALDAQMAATDYSLDD